MSAHFSQRHLGCPRPVRQHRRSIWTTAGHLDNYQIPAHSHTTEDPRMCREKTGNPPFPPPQSASLGAFGHASDGAPQSPQPFLYESDLA